jgi:hypothetical protein
MIVANDTDQAYAGAKVEVWVEDAAGRRVPSTYYQVGVDLGARSGWTSPDGASGSVPRDLASGTYFLRARISSAGGQILSTNSYELVVPDTSFGWLDRLPAPDVSVLVDGAPATPGFHYWHAGAVAYRARPGLRGFLDGWAQAQARGIDQYETVQGEHLLRHLLAELERLSGAEPLRDDIWTIRAEVVSPVVKARTLLRYVELFVRRAEARLATSRPRTAAKPPSTPLVAPAAPAAFPAVGRDRPRRPRPDPKPTRRTDVQD